MARQHTATKIRTRAFSIAEDTPYLSFACLTVVQVTQVVNLQVQRGDFQVLQKELMKKEEEEEIAEIQQLGMMLQRGND